MIARVKQFEVTIKVNLPYSFNFLADLLLQGVQLVNDDSNLTVKMGASESLVS